MEKSPAPQHKELNERVVLQILGSAGQTAASNSTGKQKTTAAKGRPQSKPKQRKRKGAPSDADDASYASDSSYVVPRGLLQWAKRREPFYCDYIHPWVEEQPWSNSDSNDKYISNGSIGSIIPPAGLLQPYRLKNRLIAARGNSSSIDSEDDDLPVSPEKDLCREARQNLHWTHCHIPRQPLLKRSACW